MAYTDDLIAQAIELAKLDPRRPKQANLRRAVSSAYYALFHEIVRNAVASLLSAPDSSGLVGDRLRRVVSHKSALNAAKWFSVARGTWPTALKSMRAPEGDPQPTVDPILERVCDTFVELQAERHRADYDLSSPFSREDTLRLIKDAEAALSSLRGLSASGDTLVFYLGCVLGDNLTKNAP